MSSIRNEGVGMCISIPWLIGGMLAAYTTLFIVCLLTGQLGLSPALDSFFFPALWLLMVGLRFILMPIAFVAAWGSDFAFDMQDRWYTRKARWIALKLKERGIAITRVDYNWLDNACAVEAMVAPEQVEVYQSAYAEIIRKSGWLWHPRKLCGSAMPREPLSREWAKGIGIAEYFMETFLLCVQCGAPHSMGFRWGDDKFHADPFANFRTKTDYHFADGSVTTVAGHLCLKCQENLGELKFASTYCV